MSIRTHDGRPLIERGLITGRRLVIAAAVIAGVVLYQEVENRLILPRVYGRVLRLPAWLITLALLAWSLDRPIAPE
jgi:predicted PurR-regulated permease PerM